MKVVIKFFPIILFTMFFSVTAHAHFGMLIPSDTMIMQHDKRVIKLDLSFSHPFTKKGMELSKPLKFFVEHEGKKIDLLKQLKEVKIMSHKAWSMDYSIKRPGVYNFVMIPTSYWEPAEDCFIKHITKTVVAAFGDDEGWDRELGLETEIIPLSKPFGLYSGNVFQGIVKLNGKAVPYAEVEVEYYNESKDKKAPTDYMVTQTIKADKNGVFTYATPGPGWWGFAALNTADYKIKIQGSEKDVELGAVIWVKFHEFK